MHPLVPSLFVALGITERADTDDTALPMVLAAIKRRDAEAEAAAEEEEEEKTKLQTALDAANANLKTVSDELAALKANNAENAEKADRADMAALAEQLGIDPKPLAKARDIRKAIYGHRLGTTARADASDGEVDAIVALVRVDGVGRGEGRELGRKVFEAVGGGTRMDSGGGRPQGRRIRHNRWGSQHAGGE